MAEPIIRIPDCSESLVLERCEQEWLRCEYNYITATTDSGATHGVGGPTIIHREIAVLYECALRDACFERLGHCTVTIYYFADEPEGSRWAIDIVRMTTPYGYFGSLLHCWRAAAQYLKVGPWAVEGNKS